MKTNYLKLVLVFLISSIFLSGCWMFTVSADNDASTSITSQGPRFISVWDTGTSNTIELPLEADGDYDFTVNWGDNTSNTITQYNDINVNHTYPTSGTYKVIIEGKLIGFNFFNGTDRSKIVEISNWGTLKLGNKGGYFAGCSNLQITATDILDCSGITNMSHAFSNCYLLKTVPSMNDWNMSNVTDMSHMFEMCNNFNQDLNNWDVSNVTQMYHMFSGAKIFNGKIDRWDVTNVLSMKSMFCNAEAFDIDISGWIVTSVKEMDSMFYGCLKLTSTPDWYKTDPIETDDQY